VDLYGYVCKCLFNYLFFVFFVMFCLIECGVCI
jgi:hypothetical protein